MTHVPALGIAIFAIAALLSTSAPVRDTESAFESSAARAALVVGHFTEATPAPALITQDPAAFLAVPVAARATIVPRSLVVAVGDRYGIGGERFADVMFCESSFRPDAIGDGGAAVGIAQWHERTWAASTRRYYGMELAPAMRLDPELALLVAARKWAAEGPWAWSCAR